MASIPPLIISTVFILGMVDDCWGLDFVSVIQVIFEDIPQLFFMLFLCLISIVLFCSFLKSFKANPQLIELKLKKLEVNSPALILFFESQTEKDLYYFEDEENKDKYIIGKYYKVIMSKDEIYDIIEQ